jgi:basic membrane protein A and related proteins
MAIGQNSRQAGAGQLHGPTHSRKERSMEEREQRRRGGRIALVVIGLTVLAVLAGCGSSSSSSSSSSSPAGASSSSSSTSSSSTNSNIKVAVLSTGAANNHSWANSWSDGVAKAATDLGVKVTMVGNVETPDQYVSQGSSFASQGYNLIIFAHGAMDAPAQKLAKQFPHVQFVQAPYEFASSAAQAAEPPNLGHIDMKQEDGSFLAGVLAAMVSKTHKLGAVYAFPFAALTRQPEGFDLGARCVSPNVSFTQKATGSFTDAALARAAATGLFSGGADVLISAVDQAVQGAISGGQAAGPGHYVVASYYDDTSLGPQTVLASILYNLNGIGEDIIKSYVNHQITPHWYKEYNLANFGVGDLALNPSLTVITAADKSKLAAFKAKIISGQIKIPDAVHGSPTTGTVGAGAKIDPKSIGC